MGYKLKCLWMAMFMACLFNGIYAQSNCPANESFTIVVLGSSTAAGTGPSSSDSAWVNRYRTYLKGINSGNQVINLAVGGTTTYHIMPTGHTPSIAGRPMPDNLHNITRALSFNPDGIIVNMPSNDASFGFDPTEQMFNFDSLIAAGNAAGVPVWVCTTQPRNNLGATKTQWQVDVKDSVLARYGNHAIDFWTTLATLTATVVPTYDAGDGIHLNNAGHRILFNRVKDRDLLATFCQDTTPPPPPVIDYAVTSVQPSNFSVCGDSNMTWTVVVSNTSVSDSSNITVNFSSTYVPGNTTHTGQQIITGGLSANEKDTLYFNSPALDVGNYVISAWIVLAADNNALNDTLDDAIDIIGTPVVSVVHDTVCTDSIAELQASAGAGDVLSWYDQLSGGNLLASGNTFITPPLNSSQAYYVEAGRGSVATASSDSLHSNFNNTHNWNGVMFDLIAHEDIVMDSFAIKMFTTGAQVVDVYQKQGSYKGHESNAASWTVVRTGTVNVSAAGQIVYLPLDSLTMMSGDTFGIYLKLRSHLGKLSYRQVPQEVNNSNDQLEMISGTGITHGWSTTYFPRQWCGSVLYHYGSTTGTGLCTSPRVAVNASVAPTPVPNLGADTTIEANDSLYLFAGNFNEYLWSTGDTTATLLADANVLGTGTHLFWVQATGAGGCSASDSVLVTVLPEVTDTTTVPDTVDYAIMQPLPVNFAACGDSAQLWQVVLVNTGPANAADVTVHFSSTHLSTNTTKSFSNNIFGGLDSAATDTFYFIANQYDAGNYDILAWISSSLTDDNAANDSATNNAQVTGTPDISLTGDTICEGDAAVLTSNITAGDSVHWYDQSVNGNLLFTGSVYNTPILVSTTTYYAQALRSTCESPVTAVVAQVENIPSPDLGGDTTIENGDSIVLNAGSFAMYNWSTSETTASLTLNGTTLGTGNHLIWITVENGSGCSGADSMIITVLPPKADYALNALEPTDFSICGNESQSWQVIVANNGANNNANITVHFSSTFQPGGPTQTAEDSLTGGLAAGTADTLHFTSEANDQGIYAIEAWITTDLTDTNATNDTLTYSIDVTGTPWLNVFNDTVCEGNSALLTAATGAGDTILWYDAFAGGSQVFGGASFTTPTLDNRTTYYAQANRGTISAAADDSLHTTFNSTHNWNGIMFDLIAYEDLVLDSLAIKMFTTGSQVVDFYQKEGTYKGHELNAASWTVVRSGTVDVSVAGQIVYLSLDELPMMAGDTFGIYLKLRNHIGKLSYLLVGQEASENTDELEIISGTGITHGYLQSYFPRRWNGSVCYHYGSNATGLCKSEVAEVVAEVSYPSPDLGPDLAMSANDSILITPGTFSSYTWSTGESSASIMVRANDLGVGTHTIIVNVADSYGCIGSDSIDVIVSSSSSSRLFANSPVIHVYPNPSNGQFTIELDAEAENGQLRIINQLGQEIFQQQLKNIDKKQLLEFNGWAKGYYFVHLTADNVHIFEKLVISK